MKANDGCFDFYDDLFYFICFMRHNSPNEFTKITATCIDTSPI